MSEQSAAFLQVLGQRLFNLRVAAGFTVRAAAQAIGVNHSMIVRYENAQATPPLERLLALAELYNTSPAALLARSNASAKLIAAIDQADSATLERLLGRFEPETS